MMLIDLRIVDTCWNENAIRSYVGGVNEKESRLKSDPNISILPGIVACAGCVENQNGLGTLCTAQITRTQFVDASVTSSDHGYAIDSMYQVPGFKKVKPGSIKVVPGLQRIPTEQ